MGTGVYQDIVDTSMLTWADIDYFPQLVTGCPHLPNHVAPSIEGSAPPTTKMLMGKSDKMHI